MFVNWNIIFEIPIDNSNFYYSAQFNQTQFFLPHLFLSANIYYFVLGLSYHFTTSRMICFHGKREKWWNSVKSVDFFSLPWPTRVTAGRFCFSKNLFRNRQQSKGEDEINKTRINNIFNFFKRSWNLCSAFMKQRSRLKLENFESQFSYICVIFLQMFLLLLFRAAYFISRDHSYQPLAVGYEPAMTLIKK